MCVLTSYFFHEFLAKSRTASCFSEWLGELSCDSFPDDRETGFGGWNEGYNFGWFCVVVEVVGGECVDVYAHLSCPWKKMNICNVVLVAFNM